MANRKSFMRNKNKKTSITLTKIAENLFTKEDDKKISTIKKDDPLLTSPLIPHIHTKNKSFAHSFMKYISGEYDEKDLLFAKNFPNIYEKLPEPKKLYLKREIHGK